MWYGCFAMPTLVSSDEGRGDGAGRGEFMNPHRVCLYDMASLLRARNQNFRAE